ncbi:SRPBCC family protein [Gulosibacter molinativorax]|uniref:Polyketide cyclase n=1 Tax=Gulosibacter molinativorax TaxID=256821 RepID=A0ABT7C9X6_9MICO|nr:SRPBCC family protein [Gulosibacter molinativorax]MDJ1371923.1 polyketide cyclase [Gulosibacter molinativorax]QUY62572.1 Prolipoprotein diacylglyceryl transferase [Gulosibacter molinativorax]
MAEEQENRIVSASRVVDASPETIFELIADPARQPEWDGNDNLASAEPGQRVTAVGDVFTMNMTKPGIQRENHVVEFEEGRSIAWKPAEPGNPPIGQLWRWELEPNGDGTLVTHTYDWTDLHDEKRLPRARATKEENLRASIDRLATLVEGQ